MTTHQLRLATEPFDVIVSGNKTIESRLYDEKRQKIQIGDQIIFTNREDPSQTATVKVAGLQRHATFRDLFLQNDPRKFGGESVEGLESQINKFYSLHDQRQNGIVGIEFELI